ncbi:MAG: hypothetical protein IJ121_11770 [Eubacterium sp.]|nr:hypothetical protein [Eubacterium sp.]
MRLLLKLCGKLTKILLMALGLLFVVYFWNLDQKLMAWAYKLVNQIFDRKKQDLNF